MPSYHQSIYSVHLSSHRFILKIEYKPIKNAYARIDKEGKLLITIPLHKKGSKLENIMIQKGQKLLERYKKYTHIKPIQNNSILLFGEQVPIEEIKKQYCKKPGTCNLKLITTKFLKKILEEYAKPILKTYSEKIGITPKKLSIRKTISKRGSCTHDQKISLNLDLIHLPTKFIKYVIIHEACHMKIKNHSKKFRALVESFLPEYKETKKQLRKLVIQ